MPMQNNGTSLSSQGRMKIGIPYQKITQNKIKRFTEENTQILTYLCRPSRNSE